MGAAIMRHAVSQLNNALGFTNVAIRLGRPVATPVIAEPLYLQAKASITVSPCLAP
jgi:hypothetical protein